MDKVFIQGLAIETLIGVFDWEREIRQRLVLDLDMWTDFAQAIAADDILKTPSYKDVADQVTALVKSTSYALVESVAEDVAALVLAEFNVQKVRVRVNKPGAVIEAAVVGVEVERERRG
ncbi:dihydroneopterin aldolase [Pokkaliibacter sp. CJK22405]|uniref:dihydroneopterin aldolase n=1 Tax=Pokkaliibacter sp. CJK22405 TaxID=3384615 RepID=UPI0039850752